MAMGAYFLFMNATRPMVKKNNPDFGVADLAKEMGKMWANITPAEKAKYEKEAAAARKKYDADILAYNKNGGASGSVSAVNDATKKGKAAAKEASDEEEKEE